MENVFQMDALTAIFMNLHYRLIHFLHGVVMDEWIIREHSLYVRGKNNLNMRFCFSHPQLPLSPPCWPV